MVKEIWDWLRVACAAVGGLIGAYFGELRGLVIMLVVFVVLDYITGVLAAIITKTLDSTVGWRGLLKKVLIFILVALSALLDKHALGGGALARTATIFFYAANEGISIIENSARCGVPIPEKLRAILEQLKDKGEKDDGSENE